MTMRLSVAVLILAGAFTLSSAFWSLDTELQFSYEVYDRSYEISAAVQAILSATARSNIIQTDTNTRSAVAALALINSQLRSAPTAFLNELAYAAASRINNEQFHIARLRTNHASYMTALESLANSTGALGKLEDVTNPLIMSTLRKSLDRIQEHSRNVLIHAESVTLRVSQARANASSLLTPQVVEDFIGGHASELVSSLLQLRNSFLLLLSSIRDSSRLTTAYGSMYDIMERSTARDKSTRNASLYNYVNSYNRVRTTLLSSVVSYRQAAQTAFSTFIQRVQSSFDDTIVRPRFDREQLPNILAFAEVVTKRVYNQSLFESSFDGMRDAIVEAYTNDTDEVFNQDSRYRDITLSLLRFSYARRYASCLNELVSEAQRGLNTLTGKYSFCLDERTSGITVVIPSTSSWLSVIRDNVNFILQQLNACLSGGSTPAARRAISDCIQSNTNNLQFYAMYLPLTVENNLKPIVQSPPLIFKNCINIIKVVAVENVDKFDEAYERCSNEAVEVVTTTTEAETTTEPWSTLPTTSREPDTTVSPTPEPTLSDTTPEPTLSNTTLDPNTTEDNYAYPENNSTYPEYNTTYS